VGNLLTFNRQYNLSTTNQQVLHALLS